MCVCENVCVQDISYIYIHTHSFTEQSNCFKSICFAATQQKNHFQFPKEPLFLRVYKSDDLMTLRASPDLKKTRRTHGPNAGVFLQKESLLLSVFRVPPSIRFTHTWGRKGRKNLAHVKPSECSRGRIILCLRINGQDRRSSFMGLIQTSVAA